MTHVHNNGCCYGKTPAEKLDHFAPNRPDGECWLWTGVPGSAGYGGVRVGGVKISAHRLAYETWVGPIPAGMTIDHVAERGCTSRLCVNPAHLEPVTRGTNSVRGAGPTGRNSRKTECSAGHKFTEENTFLRPDGARACRECRRRWSAEASAKAKEVRHERRRSTSVQPH
jgi:hypothetical protein